MKTVKHYNNPHVRCRLAANMGGTDLILLYAILIFVMFTNFLKTHENCKTPLQSACAVPAGCQNGRHRSHRVICYSNFDIFIKFFKKS